MFIVSPFSWAIGSIRGAAGKNDRLLSAVFLLAMVIGIATRLLNVGHPVDFRMLNSWREADYAQIARNFYHEDMNIFYPRVDWRGTTDGAAEMEFPLTPWVAAVGYKLLGYHEFILRVLSAFFGIAALLWFVGLAWKFLDRRAAMAASMLFSLNGLLVALSGAAQPESLQVLLCVVAAGFIWEWVETKSATFFFLSCGMIGIATMAKAPAAVLGLVLAYYSLKTLGCRAFLDTRILSGAAIALLPPVAWYTWAHHFYTTNGLSLGVSNETHLISLALIQHPWPAIKEILWAQMKDVFGLFGLALFLRALFSIRAKSIELPIVWYVSTVLFYVVIADTAGDSWAYYYHVSSVPPVCLLMGIGFTTQRITDGAKSSSNNFPSLSSSRLAATFLLFTALLFSLRSIQLYRTINGNSSLKDMYQCMLTFKDFVPPERMIVIQGGPRYDEHGHSVAYNESMAFAWMDRKGYNYAREDSLIDTLRVLKEKGGRYWIARRSELQGPRILSEIAGEFVLRDSCDGYLLYDMRGPGNGGEQSRDAAGVPRR